MIVEKLHSFAFKNKITIIKLKKLKIMCLNISYVISYRFPTYRFKSSFQ